MKNLRPVSENKSRVGFVKLVHGRIKSLINGMQITSFTVATSGHKPLRENKQHRGSDKRDIAGLEIG